MRYFILLSFIFLLFVLLAETRADNFCENLAKKFSENADSMGDNELAELKTCVTNEIRNRLFGGSRSQTGNFSGDPVPRKGSAKHMIGIPPPASMKIK